MQRLFLSAAVSALLLASGAGAPALAARTAAAARPAQVAVPPIRYTTRTLANGLTIYAARDPAASNVAVSVWYDVGSKDDPQGRSGFAHMFEHMMFKATDQVPAEYMDRITEDVGGFNNASTWDDLTNYYEVVPADHLERLLWFEASRMGSLRIEDGPFRSERDVVKEEFRQGVLANPYGRLFALAIPMATYQVHPYQRPGIGNIEQLNAATLADVRAFHKTFYRPDNASLIVVGNFDPAQLDAWVDTYFGPLKSPGTPIPRVTVVEPARTGPRTVNAWAPNVSLPAVAITWLAPSRRSEDAAALQVLSVILSQGDSSRLYSKLVYEQQLAAQVFGSIVAAAQPSHFQAGAILASGKSLADGERAVLAEVGRLRDAPVTAAELDRAKTQLVTTGLKDRQAIDDRANALGFALMWDGDAAEANAEIGKLQAVTAADVQRVARKYLPDDRRVTIFYQDESKRPADAAPWPPTPETTTPAGEAAATETPPVAKPPPLGQPVQAAVPALVERTLSNGLRVIVAKSTDLPLVTMQVAVRAGAAVDPAGKAGVADLTANLMTKGAGGRTASQLASQVEALGAELGAQTGWDSAGFGLTVATDKADKAAALLADVVIRPTLASEELERLRTQALDGLSVSLQDPGDLAGFVANNVVMAGSPYGHVLGGSPASLKTIAIADAKAAHAAWYRPDNAVLVITGALSPEQAFALAERAFGGWKRPAAAMPAAPTGALQAKPRLIVIDLPGAGQAAVSVALPGIKRSDPAYFPAVVANATLGVGYSSRLNQEIRIKRGLSYGAGSQVAARRLPGPIVAGAQTKNETAPEVVELVLAELDRLGAAATPAAELVTRKAVLTGGRGRALETTEGLAAVASAYAIQDVSLDEVKSYDADIQAVDPALVQAYAGRTLDPKTASVVVVGDAKLFLDKLRAKHPEVEVIAAKDLDLDSPTLKPAVP